MTAGPVTPTARCVCALPANETLVYYSQNYSYSQSAEAPIILKLFLNNQRRPSQIVRGALQRPPVLYSVKVPFPEPFIVYCASY